MFILSNKQVKNCLICIVKSVQMFPRKNKQFFSSTFEYMYILIKAYFSKFLKHVRVLTLIYGT